MSRLHVADWDRWQRSKTIGVALIIVAGVLSSFDLILTLYWIGAGVALIWNIEKHKRRLRSRYLLDV